MLRNQLIAFYEYFITQKIGTRLLAAVEGLQRISDKRHASEWRHRRWRIAAQPR